MELSGTVSKINKMVKKGGLQIDFLLLVPRGNKENYYWIPCVARNTLARKLRKKEFTEGMELTIRGEMKSRLYCKKNTSGQQAEWKVACEVLITDLED